ncbi:putative Ig domain-containing protein [Xanthomonas cassavae CFBP 4642]|uniref:Ig domain-containing protein n=1 Tax=Xanthomonas cassavae CFBP 4642 TaxID=1219375 RepID=A0ABS8HGE7_9XANT|nr:calcium-binding protein [Xanthomonas cassavae]MCC4620712.1 putative Ig domain-containing protein [Xanthomonas cassavae CFBP 4642]
MAEHSRFAYLQNGQYIPRNLIGNDLANTISIAAPTGFYSHRDLSYLLDGKGGDDVLKGSDANEIYVVDSLGDVIVEPTVPGYNSIDTVRASISYSLAGLQSIENIELTADDTSATGDAGNNRLDGAMAYGANTLIGGGGDDVYAIDSLDTIVEDATGGMDTAIVMRMESRSFTVAEGRNVEVYRIDTSLNGNNTLRGSSERNMLSGNAAGNYIYGGAGNDELRSGGNSGSGYTDRLYGEEGDDLLVSGFGLTDLSGGVGDDEIVLALGKDSVFYGSGDGRDLIRLVDGSTGSGSGTILFSSEIRSQDVIWSRRDNDLVISFKGVSSDSITVRNYWAQSDAGDVVTGVIDEFYFRGEQSTRKGATLEQLRNAPPVANVYMQRTSVVMGSKFAYVLPADTFVDDEPLTYSVSNLPGWLTFDAATATFSGTPDSASQWNSTLTLTATDSFGQSAQALLSIDVMNRIDGTSAADALVGTDAPDIMYGLAGNDTLNGGLSADEMYGGLGDDVYTVDAYLDRVIEFAAEGSDLVNAYTDYDLTANVERLTLLGSAQYGNGNGLDNVITGNASANVLTGGDGNDTLVGNNGDDAIEGGSGNDTLNGGAGSDYMRGGEGNDTYVVASAGDVVEEWEAQGVDTVQSSIGYTLIDNVENLTLTGNSGLAGFGNGANNVLTGNSGTNTLTGYEGNDTLDGGAGNDTMLGGAGDDTYMVGATGDTVTERVDEDMDTVLSTISYTLGSNVENLSLSGTAAINGTGNAVANILAGNSGNNTLSALGGNDTLDGRSGTDTLTGGTGDDVYLFGHGYGIDTVVENDATAGNADIARFVSGVAYDQLWFKRPSGSNNLEVSVIGTSDKLVVKDWYLGEQYRVESIRTDDGAKLLYAADVQALVSAMAGMTAPPQGQTTLTASQRTALNPTFAKTWREQSVSARTLGSGLAVSLAAFDVGAMATTLSEGQNLVNAMAISDRFESGVFHGTDYVRQMDVMLR